MTTNTKNQNPIVEVKELKICGKRRKVALQSVTYSRAIGELERISLEFYVQPLKGRRKKQKHI